MTLRSTILLLLCLAPSLAAQPDTTQQDTIVTRLVSVVDQRVVSRTTGIGVTRISNVMLRELRPLQVTEALRSVPGLFVKDYGGVGGMKSVSLRGGSAAQTLILVDGLTWNSAQNGQIDLQTIPTAFLQQITVERGGLGAVHGANAMTGAVSMDLHVPTGAVLATVDGGSFDTWRADVASGASTGSWRLGAGLNAFGSAGSFPYTIDHDDEAVDVNRANADVRSFAGIIRAEHDGDVRSTITAMARRGDRGVPGAVVENTVTQPRARMTDTDAMIHGRTELPEFISDQRMWLEAGFRYLDQHYVDPDATYSGPGGIDARYLLRDVVTTLRGRHIENAVGWTSRYHIEAGYVDLRGSSLQPGVGDLVVRRHLGASYDADVEWFEDLLLQGALRGDLYSDAGGAINGFLGAKYLFTADLTVSGSVGTGFRPPSFNELYFLNYGTSDLRPERSTTINVGGVWQALSWLSWDVQAHASWFTDLIVSVPLSPVVTSARNVGRAFGGGVESTITAQIQHELSASWVYTLQEMQDATGRAGLGGTRIPYVPVEMIAADVRWTPSIMRIGADWQYVSYRYAQPGAEYTSILAPYHLLGATVAVAVAGKALNGEVMLRFDNLLDERYQVVRGYPMPGRQFRLSVRVSS